MTLASLGGGLFVLLSGDFIGVLFIQNFVPLVMLGFPLRFKILKLASASSK